jgi:hypothetical protein
VSVDSDTVENSKQAPQDDKRGPTHTSLLTTIVGSDSKLSVAVIATGLDWQNLTVPAAPTRPWVRLCVCDTYLALADSQFDPIACSQCDPRLQRDLLILDITQPEALRHGRQNERCLG